MLRLSTLMVLALPLARASETVCADDDDALLSINENCAAVPGWGVCSFTFIEFQDATGGAWAMPNTSVYPGCEGSQCMMMNVCPASCGWCEQDEQNAADLSQLESCYSQGVLMNSTQGAIPSTSACIAALDYFICNSSSPFSYLDVWYPLVCAYHVPSWLSGGRTPQDLWYEGVLQVLLFFAVKLEVYWFAEVFHVFANMCALTYEQLVSFMWLWGAYIVGYGSELGNGIFPSDTALYTEMHVRLIENKIDGFVLCAMGAEDFIGLGVPFGVAKLFVTGVDSYRLAQLRGPIGGDFAIGGPILAPAYPGRPANVSVTLVLENMFNINELDYTFTIGFVLILSWEDDRISTRCEGVGAEGATIESYDLCGQYWQPTFTLANLLMIEEGGFEVITEFGFFTEVGMDSYRADASSKNPRLNHSIGYRVQRLKATFVTPMAFQYFPFDCQTLLVRVLAADDDSSIYRFAPMSGFAPELKRILQQPPEKASIIAGWNITALDHREILFSSAELFAEFQASGASQPSPLYDAMLLTAGTDHELTVPYYTTHSEAVFAIQVKREAHSYIYNFALLVAMLIFVSFSSFLFPDSDMNGRITLALTVFLGVIFFQILIVESLPRVGFFTTMHRFMFLSSLTNGIIVLEHALVYALQSWVGKRAEMVLRVKRLMRNRRAVRHAVRLQRAFRNHRIERLHQEQKRREEEQSKKSCFVPARSVTSASIAPRGAEESMAAVSAVPAASPPPSPPAEALAAGRVVSGDVQVEVLPDNEEEREHAASVQASQVDSIDSEGGSVRPSLARQSSSLRRRKAHEKVGPLGTAVPRRSSQHFAEQLEHRLLMAEQLAKGTPLKRVLRRKMLDWATVFLANANMFFTITTSLSYFVGILGIMFLGSMGQDSACDDPWTTLF